MIANLFIRTGLSKGITCLKNAYHSQPFKVADTTEDRTKKALRLVLMSASPGILDGDEYHQRIELEEGSVLELETQAYQRLFTMNQGASLKLTVIAANNSLFCYLPHPVVPHSGSRFTARNQVYLSRGCTLLWGEVLTPGRKLKGESFLFARYHNINEIFVEGKLVIRENLLIEPATMKLNVMGQMEGFTHQASFIFLNPSVNVRTLISRVNDLLISEQEIEFGISAAPVSGIIVRILGYRAEQLFESLKRIAALCRS